MVSETDLPSAASVAAVVDEVTSGILGIGTREGAAPTEAPSWWTCSLAIGAPAELSLVVRCPEAFARRVAEAMVGTDGQDVSDELLRESLAEFTSMVGGNLKSLVRPLSCAPLATPVVGPAEPGAGFLVSLRCGVEPITVRLSPIVEERCAS